VTQRPHAVLALADGTIFRGTSIGAEGISAGEVVFNTAMTGYQEILTDPSYCRQIITLTYPHIGNTGINQDDVESGKTNKAYAAGLVIRDLPLASSSWRQTQTLPEYLKEQGVVAIADIDTRKLTRLLREKGAQAGCLTIMFGGGSRKDWRQVAPYGGARGMLPTNPYAFAIPAGERGPVVIDFATGMAAGGKIYAAKMSGRPLAEGLCIDAAGNPTTNPDDYFNGGAILSMAGPKGYGMALVAELLGEAILGQAMDGMNWICLAIDLSRFRASSTYRAAAEECLAELRDCPPAPGFDRVEVPGEREAALRLERLTTGIPIPPATLASLRALGVRLGVDAEELVAMA